jgi:hypothetical protein
VSRKAAGVPAWDWLLHELWWWISRWPRRERQLARAAVANHYVNRHLLQAVQAAGVHKDQQPQAWQHLVRCLDLSLSGTHKPRCCDAHNGSETAPAGKEQP